MDSLVKKLKEIAGKIRTDKKAQIFLAGGLIVLLLLVFFLQTGVFTKNEGSTNTQQTVSKNDYSETNWEKRLAEIISEIKGVGKTDVMITFSSTNEKITANTTTTNTSGSQNGSGTITTSTHTTSTPVLTGASGKSEPYIVQEKMPDVIGVIVVAKGAEDPVTRLSILRAVQTALNVPASCVEIYSMN